MSLPSEFVVIARILRPQGRRGEVLAEILTDFPEKFSERSQLWLGKEGNRQPREYLLTDHWLHKGCVVLKFASVESISDAELLSGFMVQVPREQRAKLSEGAIYVADLIGCMLVDTASGGHDEVGEIAEVRQSGGAAPLLVIERHGAECEIPFAEEHVVRFDAAKRILEMKLPIGLLEVNAPLTKQKKKQK